MDNDAYKSLLSMHIKIDAIHTDLDRLGEKFNKLGCAVNNEKIKKLEKIVYGAVALVLIAFMASLITNNGNKKASAGVKEKPAIIVEK